MCRIQVLKRGRWDFFSALPDSGPPLYQVRIAAAVCTFLMKCLVVSKKCLIFAA